MPQPATIYTNEEYNMAVNFFRLLNAYFSFSVEALGFNTLCCIVLQRLMPNVLSTGLETQDDGRIQNTSPLTLRG